MLQRSERIKWQPGGSRLRAAGRGSILLSSYQEERPMAKAASSQTRVSTKGQVILPKAIRDRRNWTPGTELTIEDRPEGVLLKASPRVAPTKVEDVFGRLGPVDRVLTVEEMDAAVMAEAHRRHLRKSR
jgi:AbrB family looped-hinge helix DNA binding protein